MAAEPVPNEPLEVRQARAARNESLVREVNERLEEAISDLSMFHEFVCECALPDCTETVPLTQDEYEAIRQHPARFAVKPGHLYVGVERVVDGAPDRYAVVEKIERGAKIAARLDPRGRQRLSGD